MRSIQIDVRGCTDPLKSPRERERSGGGGGGGGGVRGRRRLTRRRRTRRGRGRVDREAKSMEETPTFVTLGLEGSQLAIERNRHQAIVVFQFMKMV